MAKSSKLDKAVSIAKCVDKLFDALIEEKLLDKDNDIVCNIKTAKDSFKKTVASFNEEEKKTAKPAAKKAKKSKSKKTKATEVQTSEASVT